MNNGHSTQTKLSQWGINFRLLKTACLLLAILPVFIHATKSPLEKISITVLNDDALPIKNARVQLLGHKKLVATGITDTNGLVVFEKIAPEVYCIEIKASGYEELSACEVEIKAGVDNAKTYVLHNLYKDEADAEKVKDAADASGRAAFAVMNKKMSSEAAMPVSMDEFGASGGGNTNSATAGQLTAGELNNLAKFDMWQGLSESELGLYRQAWKLNMPQRYALVVRNAQNGAVINAQVKLLDANNNTIWMARTNNAGRVELWDGLYGEKANTKLRCEVAYGGFRYNIKKLEPYEKGINQVRLPVDCEQIANVDIAFVVDATGSMGDEIAYLKAELKDVIDRVQQNNQQLNVNTASVFYRDLSDTYVTKVSDMTPALSQTTAFIAEQQASGGGDFPEAVDSALSQAVNGLSWREDCLAKLLFLVLDAPPHNDEASVKRMQLSIAKAAEKGIRIIPIVASGTNKSNEYLMRSAAIATNGTFIFLTDHSGIGNPHIAPSTDAYDVTYLNDLMVNVINRFTGALSCSNITSTAEPLQILAHEVSDSSLVKLINARIPDIIELDAEVLATRDELDEPAHKTRFESDSLPVYSLYPNPCANLLQVATNTLAKKIYLLDASGQLLREYPRSVQQFSMDVSAYASGIYFVGFEEEGGKMHTERFIISR